MSNPISQLYQLGTTCGQDIELEYPVLKQKYKQVMGPEPTAEHKRMLTSTFGKLQDESLTSVWKIFFERRIFDFDQNVFIFYKEGPQGLQKRFDLSLEQDMIIGRKMQSLSNNFLDIMFKLNVSEDVLILSKLRNMFINREHIHQFVETYQPNPEKFTEDHVKIAEYLMSEMRNSQGVNEKSSRLTRMKHSVLVEICMYLLELYRASEISAVFEKYRISDKTPVTLNSYEEEVEFIRLIGVDLEKHRRSRSERQIA